MSEKEKEDFNRIEENQAAEEPKVRWTPEQQKVIDLRDRSMLVSAAAGSGKTAVLVQRIISMITDRKHPVDVDELLVVTFTNAAAAEMRERVLAAIEKAVEAEPSNAHLQRQLSLIHNAQITTIDSFCKQVLQNHFHKIGLEPGFRIADEGELKLLREDVCDQVLEQFYQERDPAFLKFADSYASAKSDQQIRDMMLRLYDFSESYPWPEEWLDACAGQYEAASVKELEEKQWVRDFLDYLQIRVEEMAARYKEVYALTLDEDGPQQYEGVVRDDLRQLEELLSTTAVFVDENDKNTDLCLFAQESSKKISNLKETPHVTSIKVSPHDASAKETLHDASDGKVWASALARWQESLRRIQFKTLPRGGKYKGSEEKRETVKTTRDQIKAQIKELREKYFSADIRSQLEVMQKTGEMVQTLVDVTKAFSEAFAEEKAKKNILDFSDLEHMALQILVNPETKEPTETAAEYRERFREVMIDEYQDSNYVQEALLTAVSGIPEGKENLFMVGDVKQSIYRFRLARPELFMEKYAAFSTEESKTQRIDLHKNFRSRREVIEVVNDIFGRIMGRDLGNVEYDEDAALYMGGSFDCYGNDSCCQPECLLVEEDPYERDRKITEARVAAQRIRELIQTEEIPGKQYRDVVILLRSVSGWSEAFQTVFEQEGIPLRLPSQTGYFSAQEVQTVLSMLRVLDNPSQDLPLTTLMRSPIGRFSGDELAKIRLYDGTLPFFAAVAEIGRKGKSGNESDEAKTIDSDGVQMANVPVGQESDREKRELKHQEWMSEYSMIRKKVQEFWKMLESFRSCISYTPIHTLIQQIYDETGYRDYVAALPAGDQRRANLDMLLEKAVAYEQTSYHGLYHFIRYIDRLMKYDVDYGEAETVSEQENAVRLMTIHKSKGLEFPIVVLAGMGKQFNMQDERDRMIFHPEFGIGLKYFDSEKRTKQDTLIRQIFSIETKKENLGEELRILYVALTRAKEKLILTGAKPKKDGTPVHRRKPFEKLDFSLRMDAKCYWDWVLPALESCKDVYPVRIVRLEDRLESESRKLQSTQTAKREMEEFLQQADSEVYEKIDRRLSWRYPYKESGAIRQKVSVSEIKHRAMEEARELLEESGEETLFPEEIPVPYLPKFVQEQEENAGALRGTAVHRFLECLDFAALPDFSEDSRRAELMESEAAGEVPQTLDSGNDIGENKPCGCSSSRPKPQTDNSGNDICGNKPCGCPSSRSNSHTLDIYSDICRSKNSGQRKESLRQWLKNQAESFVQTGRMRQEEADLLNLYQMERFFSGKMVQRMAQAAKNGFLTKEQPFVMSLPAAQVWREADSEESVLVQGIIDVFWEEEDGIVLLDYKTDRVTRAQELVQRYEAQLRFYAEALNRRFTDKKVKEILIYSFRLNEVIVV